MHINISGESKPPLWFLSQNLAQKFYLYIFPTQLLYKYDLGHIRCPQLAKKCPVRGMSDLNTFTKASSKNCET